MPEPTTTEWVIAAVAAVLVVLFGGLLFILPALRRGATPASRMAGFLLSCLATAVVVIAAVLVVAGIRASKIDPAAGEDRPTGAFARYLLDRDPASTERAATYGAAVLLPLAAVLGVLALAVVDLGRSIGLRAIAGLTCGTLLIASVLVIIGDAGPLAARTAVGIAVLSAAAAAALATDELRGPRRAAP